MHFKGVVLSVLAVLIIQHVIKVIFMMDYHRSVNYHHSPGPCKQIIEGNGSEDVTVLPSGLALITTNLYEEVGQIKLVDLTDPELKVENVVIEGGDSLDQFMVKAHGLSTWIDEETGTITVAVITHPDFSDDRVEMFTFHPNTRTLKHTHSVTDPILYNLNDLVLVSKDSFYTTKTHQLRRGWRTLESLMTFKWGEILFYDGKAVKTMVTGLSFPNGINISPSLTHVYLAELIPSTVHVYRRFEDNSLKQVQSVFVDSHVDNIEVDQKTGDLWIGSHPIIHQLATVLSTFENNKDLARGLISPSQSYGSFNIGNSHLGHVFLSSVLRVFKLKTEDDSITDVIEVYLNNGTEITGSSIAAVYGNKMIVGSIASETLVCDLIYTD